MIVRSCDVGLASTKQLQSAPEANWFLPPAGASQRFQEFLFKRMNELEKVAMSESE
jgi:hypothetical protein